MVQFMDLVICGQEKLRDLLKVQTLFLKEQRRKKDLFKESIFDSDLETLTFQAVEEDGKQILIQSKSLIIALY